MYCIRCGKAIADDSLVCPHCGAKLDVSDNPFSNDEPVYSMPAATSTYQAPPVKRKKKTGIIIAVVLILAVLGGGAYAGHWYFHRPIMLITKAIEENDIKTVVELFNELDEETDIDYVEKCMASYATKLQESFINHDKDYDEVMDELELLGKDILKDNSRYERIITDINDLNQSRENFEKAEKAFKKEDYEKASELYAKVSMHDDDNYEAAKEKIEEIKKLMIPDVIGTWRTTIDMAPAVVSLANIGTYGIDSSILSKFTFPVDLLLLFNEDDTCVISCDSEEMAGRADEMIDALLDLGVVVAAKELGMSVEELDKYIKMVYGKDTKSMLYEEAGGDRLKNEFVSGMEGDFYELWYIIDGDKIDIYENKSDMSGNGYGPVMTLTLYDNTICIERNTMSLPQEIELCIEYPLTFTKDEE